MRMSKHLVTYLKILNVICNCVFECLVNVAGFYLIIRVRSMCTTDGNSTPFYR